MLMGFSRAQSAGLLVMLAVVSALTFQYLTPTEMVSYARSMLAASRCGVPYAVSPTSD